MQKRVGIIGAGFAGLTAALYLQKMGYDVSIFEKNSHIGGRAQTYSHLGYTFNLGPSWYLQPDVFERIFKDLDISVKELNLKRLDPYYRFFFDDDTDFDISDNTSKIIELFESLEPGAGKQLSQYLSQSKELYDLSVPELIEKSFDKLSDFLDPALRKKGAPVELLKSLDSYVSKFFKSKKIHQILEYNVLFLGGSPWISPALYAILTHVDYNLGVWYPKGGMIAVAKLLEKYAKKRGIKIHVNSEIQGIKTNENRIVGLIASSKLHKFDTFLSTADYHHVETQLLPKDFQTYPENYWEKKILAPSALIFMIGTNKKIPNIAHHNLFISSNWEDHFSSIFDHKRYPANPSFYVSCSSKDDTTIAPKNCDILYVLIPLSAGLPLEKSQTSRLRDYVYQRISRVANFEFRNTVKFVKEYTSVDFEKDYNAYQGTALGLAHTLLQTAYFRPHHHSSKLKNLYYAGQYTHPGVGVPTSMTSGKIAALLIHHDVS